MGNAQDPNMAAGTGNNHLEVLVVEDDPDINQMVGAYAEIAGFRYRSALNGETALREAHSSHPSLIVLDVMLPDLDGFEVCRRLKSDRKTSGIPVLMLTALDRDEHRRSGAECGAAAYMTKPFDPDKLLEMMRSLARHEPSAN